MQRLPPIRDRGSSPRSDQPAGNQTSSFVAVLLPRKLVKCNVA